MGCDKNSKNQNNIAYNDHNADNVDDDSNSNKKEDNREKDK